MHVQGAPVVRRARHAVGDVREEGARRTVQRMEVAADHQALLRELDRGRRQGTQENGVQPVRHHRRGGGRRDRVETLVRVVHGVVGDRAAGRRAPLAGRLQQVPLRPLFGVVGLRGRLEAARALRVASDELRRTVQVLVLRVSRVPGLVRRHRRAEDRRQVVPPRAAADRFERNDALHIQNNERRGRQRTGRADVLLLAGNRQLWPVRPF